MANRFESIRVFASHDWGTDGVNHARVSSVVDGMRKRGLDVWFDETHMKGNILSAMCKGMDTSDVVLVFVTNNYIKKVETGVDTDNVKREFMYAAEQYPEKIHAVRFDDSLAATWGGPVGMVLGSNLYTDMTTVSDHAMDGLVDTIRRHSGKTLWKSCTQKARVSFGALKQHRPAPSTPQLNTLETKLRSTKMKARVASAFEAMGMSMVEEEHTNDALDRLVLSLIGEKAATKSLAFHEKVKLVEKELGLVPQTTDS